MRTKELISFVRERYKIYVKRQAGNPKPWTKDHILRSYRFCNVYRELDTQTKWLHDVWGKGGKQKDKDYWFACVVFRLTNWAETATQIGYPVPWNHKHFVYTLATRKKLGLKVYSGAYTISTNGVAMEKHLYLANQLDKMWEDREAIRYRAGECLHVFYDRLIKYNCMGTFLAAQVVADMKFCGSAKDAPDWWTFVAPGPGSERGLARVYGFNRDVNWRADDWEHEFKRLYAAVTTQMQKYDMPRISAQDLQNCLCEFDKYERVRLAEGRPRSTYEGI